MLAAPVKEKPPVEGAGAVAAGAGVAPNNGAAGAPLVLGVAAGAGVLPNKPPVEGAGAAGAGVLPNRPPLGARTNGK